jgi:leucyl-tRNA synthetase
VNWDPVDQTVLANEQVVDGRGWRSGAPVERREMQQWFLKITDYAEELLAELDNLEGWPESVKSMQRNWIGRSEGVEIDFPLPDRDEVLTVYTTRPDTLIGATYVAVAAEHPLARRAAEADPRVADFVEQCRNLKTAEAELATIEKQGIATGLEVVHPLTGAALPVWVANFVLMEYGSGAVMSVPGHDQRDWEFARKYGIPIRQVIAPLGDEPCDLESAAFTAAGRLVNSGAFDGLTSAEAFDAIATALADKGLGRRRTNYRLRDWGVSRQRYWGCPIPMIHCPSCGIVPVPDEALPVVLPTDVKFEGVRSPLTTMESFYRVSCPGCGGEARRETDTFDTFMESSWYYARFACPDANAPMLDERANHWTPVDHYVGGIEHAILHLLYARFFHKLMRDHGLVNSDEPFTRLLMLGMVLKDGRKMSKSSGDAGNPQALLDKYGADAVRSAMMFAAPPDQSFEWSESGVEGQARFCKRLWTLVHEHMDGGPVPPLVPERLSEAARELRRKTHETLQRADDDFGRRMTFNTVVSAVHELTNTVSRLAPLAGDDRAAAHEALKAAVLVFSPIAPHVTQRLWHHLGESGLLVEARWPEVDQSALVQQTLELVIQVNGKVRGRVAVPADASEAEVREVALANENVVRFLEGKAVRKVITVPGKLINVVVG